MRRIELNVSTGERCEIEQLAYKTADNKLVLLDVGKDADNLTPVNFEELEQLSAPPPPTALDQIRAKEQAQNVRDAMERANRLAALVIARTELVRQQAAKGSTVTHDQAHAFLYANDKAYKLLWDVEQEVAPLRKLIP